jgi:hypothetical protein
MRICLFGAGFVALGLDKGSVGVTAMATLPDDERRDKQRQERTTATAETKYRDPSTAPFTMKL